LLSQLDAGILSQAPHQFHAKVFDGAAIIHALPTKQAVTFDEYGNKVFLSWMKQQLSDSGRIDMVWDKYIAHSLKESAREKRGKGIRRKVKK